MSGLLIAQMLPAYRLIKIKERLVGGLRQCFPFGIVLDRIMVQQFAVNALHQERGHMQRFVSFIIRCRHFRIRHLFSYKFRGDLCASPAYF